MSRKRTLGAYCLVAPLSAHYGCPKTALLILGLEYWFDRTGSEHFYKFLEPCTNTAYRPGDSWTEELGLSREEFVSAFDRVAIRYKSKTALMEAIAAGDPFNGKLYLSYTQRNTGHTFYMRNHSVAEGFLSTVAQANSPKPAAPDCATPNTPAPETEKSRFALNNLINNPSTTNTYIPEPEIQLTPKPNPTTAPVPPAIIPVAALIPVNENPPNEAQVAHFLQQERNWTPASAQKEAQRMVQYYGSRNWHTPNGHRITDWQETARRWKPARAYTRADALPTATRPATYPTPLNRPDTPPKAKLPTDWNPALYAKLSYLQQLDYMRQLEALGWQKVRPPHGTPAVIDRWYVPPGTGIEGAYRGIAG